MLNWNSARSSMKHLLAAAALVALLLFLATRNVSSGPYIYDEADYMYAASLGYLANWTDTPTLALPDFLRIGLGRGRQSGGRQELSQFIRQSNDVVFYRHWHGPLYFFLLIPISRLGLNEHAARTAMLTVPAVTVVALYFGCLWLIPGILGSVAATLASMLFLSSWAVVRSTELAPHHLFVFCFLCCLILLAKTVATGRRSYWYAAVVAAALAFCTLEVAFVAVLTLAICAFIERDRLGMSLQFVVRSCAAFLATVLVVWPSAIFKLSFVKAYLFMAYLALLRKGSWGNIGFFGTWGTRVVNSPLEYVLVACALFLFLRTQLSKEGARKESPPVYPALVFGFLMVAATLRVLSETPRYSLPFMPAFDLFAGLMLGSFLGTLRRPTGFAAAGLLLAGLYAGALVQTFRHPLNPNPRPSEILALIRDSSLTDKALLVPQEDLPMIHYYFPATRLRGYYEDRPSASDVQSFVPDAALYPGYPLRLDRAPR